MCSVTTPIKQPPKRVLDCWRHQSDAYWFAFDKPATLLAMDMGTGKSKVAIDLLVNWECKKTLIICPKNVLGVWRREFPRHADNHFSICILDKGTVVDKIDQAAKHINDGDGPRVVVVNYETARMESFTDRVLRPRWDAVILDESRHVKAHNTKQSKLVAKLGLHATRRLCLTGTPMPHSPLDLFGQFRFLDPDIFPAFWTHFRAKYAIMGVAAIPQMITGYQNQDEMKELMSTITFRVGSEVLNLLPTQHHVKTFTLCPTAQRHYRELKQEMITEVAEGVCTIANCLVKTIRLRQITSGYIVQDDTKKIHRVDDGRQKLLLDTLAVIDMMDPDESHPPVVVFCNFHHDLDRIAEVAEGLGRRYGEISGRSRGGLTDQATMTPDIDLLGVQIQAGGEGIDLTRSHYAIYYSQTYSLGDYAQSMARLNRPGQTRSVNYYHLVAENTIDVKVREALANKQKVVDVILDVFRKGESDG